MDEKQYKEWISRIKSYMKLNGDDKKFIDFAVYWFETIKGKNEIELLREYHPLCANKTDGEIFELISFARAIPSEFYSDKEEFANQIGNSAFFLYYPYLKAKFNNEQLNIFKG